MSDIIDARKGLAAPPPVIWGRRPCPSVELLFPKFEADVGDVVCVSLLNGCELDPKEPPYKPPLLGDVVPSTAKAGLPEIAGVVGEEPGIGGRDSISEAPKDDDGLNGLRPANPVKWDLTGPEAEDDDALVAPVGWVDREDEKSESENVDPVVVVAVFCALRAPTGEKPDVLGG